jgi:hypothetical protein
MSKKETLCKWDKDQIKKDWDELVAIVQSPTHICKRCCRAVSDKDRVCKPEKIK